MHTFVPPSLLNILDLPLSHVFEYNYFVCSARTSSSCILDRTLIGFHTHVPHEKMNSKNDSTRHYDSFLLYCIASVHTRLFHGRKVSNFVVYGSL